MSLKGTVVTGVCLGVLLCRDAVAGNVLAVLSSNLAPYEEAYAGFQEAIGESTPQITLSQGKLEVPNSTRIIVAIGGKAALANYPEGKLLIYCLAPGVQVKSQGRDTRVIKIHNSPQGVRVISKLKEIQPGLKHLAVLWTSPSLEDYVSNTSRSPDLGIAVSTERLESTDDLPNRLRALKGKADALWVLPDPLLINPTTIAMLKEYSWSNRIPFYAPTEGLVEQGGAVAAVSSSFRETGRVAGLAARRATAGTLDISEIYPEQIHITLNMTVAKQTGLEISSTVLKEANKVLP
jgi:ABC-type uncharacterized transport system substrate-binding protein